MDKCFFPYGTKSKDFLIKRTIYLVRYLTLKKVDRIILACNTLSLLVLDEVKKYFKTEIIGVFELFDFSKYKGGLLIGTINTISILKNRNLDLDFIEEPYLIEAIETDRNIDAILEEKKDIYNKYPYVLLGCTHFINIKTKIKNSVSQDELYLARYNSSDSFSNT